MVAVLSVLWNRMRASPSKVERARLAYLFFGACVAVLLSTLDVLPRFGVPYPVDGLGSISLTLFMFFLSQTLQRHRLLDLHEFLGKIVVVSSLALVLVAVYGGLVSWVGNRPELFAFNTVVASFVILSLFEPLREKVDEWVVVTLFRERYELVRHLERLRDRAATVIEPAGLAAVVLDGLEETRRVTHASLWLLADDRPGYRLLDSRGPRPAPFLEPATARALLAATGSGQKAVLLENLERRRKELRVHVRANAAADGASAGAPSAVGEELARLADARAAMATMRAGIAMPLAAGDRVIGFLACWDERVPEAFASNEIAALIEVAERCALVIENSKLYLQMKERDRLAAIGEMSAGLAHEIRNPLAAISHATELLGEEKRGEDRERLTRIIRDNAGRLERLVSDVLQLNKRDRVSAAPLRLQPWLGGFIAEFVANEAVPAERIVLETRRESWIEFDREHLHQVMWNLLRNAARYARPEPAAIRIRLDGYADRVELSVIDNGPGVPAPIQAQLFEPFFTTEAKGTGLGLYLARELCAANRATLEYVNDGAGAHFRIRCRQVKPA
jgi:signal transduction histidine kinase